LFDDVDDDDGDGKRAMGVGKKEDGPRGEGGAGKII
jgi:hypothetical protein